MAEIELIAHRGLAARFPENSLPGIEAAIREGARYVEVDVQLSCDGLPVLFHDRDLTRVCGVAGAVHDRLFAELMQLAAPERARFGERFADNRVASLQQLAALLDTEPPVRGFVEIKSLSVERFGAGAVLDAVLPVLAPVADRCILISFSIPLLHAARRRRDPLALGGVVSRWADREHMAGLGLEYLFCDVDGLPAAGPLAFESARLAAYEVNDPALARSLAARGVHLIETFDLPGLRAQLDR
jgi:glycerophosphoryl diester phosphodiesterase